MAKITRVPVFCLCLCWCLNVISVNANRKTVKTKKSKVDCLIVSEKGFSDPGNVYQCEPFQVCCLEYDKASCCGYKPTSQIIKEQVILWGGLFAFLAFLGLIVFCRMNDFYVMESKEVARKYLPCLNRRSNKVIDGVEYSTADMKLHFDGDLQP